MEPVPFKSSKAENYDRAHDVNNYLFCQILHTTGPVDGLLQDKIEMAVFWQVGRKAWFLKQFCNILSDLTGHRMCSQFILMNTVIGDEYTDCSDVINM